MKEYIKRSDIFPNGVFFVNEDNPMTSLDELINRICNAPTIDAVPVVRCKDCKWCSRSGLCNLYLSFTPSMKPDDFCSYGERREPNEN